MSISLLTAMFEDYVFDWKNNTKINILLTGKLGQCRSPCQQICATMHETETASLILCQTPSYEVFCPNEKQYKIKNKLS